MDLKKAFDFLLGFSRDDYVYVRSLPELLGKKVYNEFMFIHETKIRVRYGETDQMGVMYYGNYPEILEVGRAELLRSIDPPYKSFEEKGKMMPVSEMTIKYLRPALYDDEITIKTYLKKLPSIRMYLAHELFNEKGDLLTTAEITLVMMDMKTNRPCQPPVEFIEKFEGVLLKFNSPI